MLHSIFPKVDHQFLSMPLLGPVVEGFDDWLAANGYTRRSRKHAIRMLRHVEVDLRRRQIGDVAVLTHAVLDDCWRDRNKLFPGDAGTVRTLERYLITNSMIAAPETGGAPVGSAAAVLTNEYANYLHDVAGFAVSTIQYRRYVSRCFLDHLDAKKISLRSIQPSDIEGYILQAGRRLSRASLQQEIVALRGLLRFLSIDGRVPHGLDLQIDTPRLYRPEQLPRALPWDTVKALLRSIDTTSAVGLRDYAMLLLIATYGLRSSEVVAITLDDIHWRQGRLCIHQRKTSSPLELPLTNEVAAGIVKHLKRTPPQEPHRRIFLRMHAPIGLLKPSAIAEAFHSQVRKSGLSIPLQGPHCLRHSLAVHLMKNGTPLKTIGDILGHRTAGSTSIYLRLATGDLREVALAVPGKTQRKFRKVTRP
jgi:integrase/recombinase XerD